MLKKESDIIDSALYLFVSKGFHGSSTAAIAENAGVSNGTLFHYFRSKNELIQRLHQIVKSEQILKISANLEEDTDPKEKIRLIWKQSIEWAILNEEKYYFLLKYKYSPYKLKHKTDVDQFRKMFNNIVERGVQLKTINFLPEGLIFDLTSAHVYGMIEYLKSNPVKFRTPEFMKQAFELLWKSIKM